MLFEAFQGNGSHSKNLGIKTPLVMSFSLGVVMKKSPLAAFGGQGSSKDFHYLPYYNIHPNNKILSGFYRVFEDTTVTC